jgi:hypothetical protein
MTGFLGIQMRSTHCFKRLLYLFRIEAFAHQRLLKYAILAIQLAHMATMSSHVLAHRSP